MGLVIPRRIIMKVAIVIERYNPLRGGAERSTMEMAAALARLGHEVTIVAGRVENEQELESPEGVSIANLGVRGSRSVWFKYFDTAAVQYLSCGGFDIIHSISPISMMDVYQPRAGSQLHSMKRHFEVYTGFRKLYKSMTAGFNRARVMRLNAERKLCTGSKVPMIAVLSDYVARQFTADYGVSNDRMSLVRNAINVALYKGDSLLDDSKTLRKKFDPDGELAVLLHVSEDPLRKGLEELIHAVAVAKRSRPAGNRQVRLVVVGSYDYTKYYNMVRRYNIEGSVVFFGPSREVPLLMKMADALVLPTWDDACSRVVMESLAAGTPAISTSFNGASELFSCGRYGIEVESPCDIEALAQAINKVANVKECQAMKEAIAGSGLLDSLSMDRHGRELTELYKKCRGEG